MKQNTVLASKHKGNTAITVIIIALCVVCVVLIVNKIKKGPTGPVEQCPWTEEDRIVNSISEIKLPQSPQISLDMERKITYKITSEDGEDRGKVLIIIDPEGPVFATWRAKYKEGSYDKEFDASCSGNVDAENIYIDEEGADPSKLFFITKGSCQLKAFRQGNAVLGGSDAYIVGWIAPDGTATGTIVLAPSKKDTRIYKWGNK